MVVLRKLAADTVPGFQINALMETRPIGSYRTGGPELFRAVNQRTINNGEDIKQACIYLSRHSKVWLNHNPSALGAAYHRYKAATESASIKLREHPIYGPMVEAFGLEELIKRLPKAK